MIYAQYGNAQRSIISKSINGGASFDTSGLEGNPFGINRGVPAFWVSPAVPIADPSDPTVIITGGQDLYRSVNGVFESNAIGGHAYPFYDPPYPHVDMQTIVADPLTGTNKSVFLGTDGGIFYAEDVTSVKGLILGPSPGSTPIQTPSGWTVMNNQLQNTQYFTVSGDTGTGPTPAPRIIAGGTMDNGTLRLVGTSPDTESIWGGDGGLSAVDGRDCFGQDSTRNVYRIYNCDEASPASPNAFEVARVENLSDFIGLNEIIPTPFKLDPHTSSPKRAFLGIRGLWKTDNVKVAPPLRPTWIPIKPNVGFSPTASPTPTATATASPTGTLSATPTGTPTPRMLRPRISTMALAPSDSNHIWVSEFYPDLIGLGYSHLWRTENALAPVPTWTRIDSPSPSPQQTPQLPNRFVTKILIDKNNSLEKPDETVYVAFGGFKEDNLWRTRNHGGNWEDISGGSSAGTCDPLDPLGTGLPCAPIRAIAQHPYRSNTLYVGTEIGIYVTTTLNASDPQNILWEPVMKEGPANVSIDDLEFMKNSNVLLVGTWGRGVWTTDFGPTPQPTRNPINDFDGDGRSDLAVVRDDGTHLNWHRQGSSDGYNAAQFGAAGDQIAPADYDGDGKTDMGVFRPSESRWYSLLSSSNTLATTDLGDENAKSVPADFDGDSLADKAVWKSFEGIWEVEQTENGHLTFQWGAPGDKPVSMDFNGDGSADFGLYRETNGMITLHYWAGGAAYEKQFGLEGDVPVPGDYDGDGKMDLAVWRPDDDGEGNGCWYIIHAADAYEEVTDIPWGENGDVPVPGDYDGDGKLDIAVWRPGTGMWHLLQSSNGYYSELFGADGDTPVGIKAVYNARPSGRPFTRVPPNAMPRRRESRATTVSGNQQAAE